MSFRGRRYIILLENFYENAFLNVPSYWGVADSAQIEEHCLTVIERSELSWRAQCSLRESQIQSHRAGGGLRVECRLNDRDATIGNGFGEWIAASGQQRAERSPREQNVKSESERQLQRASQSKKRKRETVLETNVVTESTVQFPAS